jgi:hypothetical protein
MKGKRRLELHVLRRQLTELRLDNNQNELLPLRLRLTVEHAEDLVDLCPVTGKDWTARCRHRTRKPTQMPPALMKRQMNERPRPGNSTLKQQILLLVFKSHCTL